MTRSIDFYAPHNYSLWVFERNIQRTFHFLAVAKAGSLSAAARELGISQPALTASIRKLEERVGFDLFDREHGFHLTEQGRDFHEKAARTFSKLRDLERDVDSIRTGTLGEVRTACGPTVADGIMGPAIARLLAAHEGLNIHVTVAPFASLPGLLRERKIDFFVADHTLLSGLSDLEIVPLEPQEIVFFCRAGHPLAGQDDISVDEFFSYPHVGPPLPPWAEDWLRTHRPQTAASQFLRVECSHHALLKNVVETSDAISGAPRCVIQSELDLGRFALVSISLPPMHNRAGIVWLTDRPPTAAGKLLIEELRRTVE